MSSRAEKKLEKTLVKHFTGKSFSRFEIDFPSNRANDIWDENILLYRLKSSRDTLGYVTVSRAKGRYDYFDFMIIYSLCMEVELVQVLVYRSEHGGEIAARRWLNQFKSSSASRELSYGKDVEAISGATLSGASITDAINSLNMLMAELRKEGIL